MSASDDDSLCLSEASELVDVTTRYLCGMNCSLFAEILLRYHGRNPGHLVRPQDRSPSACCRARRRGYRLRSPDCGPDALRRIAPRSGGLLRLLPGGAAAPGEPGRPVLSPLLPQGLWFSGPRGEGAAPGAAPGRAAVLPLPVHGPLPAPGTGGGLRPGRAVHQDHHLPPGLQGQAGRVPVRRRRERQGGHRPHGAAGPLSPSSTPTCA